MSLKFERDTVRKSTGALANAANAAHEAVSGPLTVARRDGRHSGALSAPRRDGNRSLALSAPRRDGPRSGALPTPRRDGPLSGALSAPRRDGHLSGALSGPRRDGALSDALSGALSGVDYIQERVVQTRESPLPAPRRDAPLPGTSGKHPIAEKIGTAITGGMQNAGTKGYLMAYINQLEKNPLRTKMLTAGTLASMQELIASFLAKDRNKHGNYFTSRVPKMAAYGALVSAPLGHFLIWCLQKTFKGRTSLRAKIMQIIVSNLVIAPIQNSIYLVAMALIAGARTYHQVRATVRVGFMKVMKVTWITSPLCLAFAQQFLPESAWVPFFNVAAFIIGTYINTMTKKKRLAALRKKHFGDGRGDGRGSNTIGGRPEDYPGPMGPNHPPY